MNTTTSDKLSPELAQEIRTAWAGNKTICKLAEGGCIIGLYLVMRTNLRNGDGDLEGRPHRLALYEKFSDLYFTSK